MGRGTTPACAVLALLWIAAPAAAATLTVRVDDGRGALADAVVELSAPDPGATAAPTRHYIDQKDETFIPYLTVLRRGDSIEFRNSDYTRHHVYTFSPIHPFEFVVPSGSTSEPVTFEQAGVAAVGCNIHDRMIAYVFVSDAARVRQSDPDGIVRFDDVAPGRYVLHAWHPRLRAGGRGIEREIDVPARDAEPVVVSLRVDAAPPAADRERPVY